MAYAIMTETMVPGYINSEYIYEYEDTKTAAANGDSVLIPGDKKLKVISVTIIPTAGSGKIQTTTSSVADVMADAALWDDTNAGVVASQTTMALELCTAIRQVNVTGSTKMTVTVR